MFEKNLKKLKSTAKIFVGDISIWNFSDAPFMSKTSFSIFQLFDFLNSDYSYFRDARHGTHIHLNQEVWTSINIRRIIEIYYRD